MNYRIAIIEDLAQLAELRWDFRMEDDDEPAAIGRPEFVEACISFLKRALENDFYTYWLAETNREIVAHIFVHKVDLVPRPCKIRDRFGYMTNNYVKPSYRNQGIGSKLMQEVTAWAKAEDMELLIVYPSEQAVSFYERAGFDAENEVMELRLRESYSSRWTDAIA